MSIGLLVAIGLFVAFLLGVAVFTRGGGGGGGGGFWGGGGGGDAGGGGGCS